MPRFTTIKDLQDFRSSCIKEMKGQEKKILVCAGTGCVAGGSIDIYNKFIEICTEKGINVQVSLEKHVEHPIGVKKTGCNGFCELGPLVRIEPQGWLYTKVKIDDCEEIINSSIIGGELIERLVYCAKREYAVQEEIPFYKKQNRVVFENCGHIDAEDIIKIV